MQKFCDTPAMSRPKAKRTSTRRPAARPARRPAVAARARPRRPPAGSPGSAPGGGAGAHHDLGPGAGLRRASPGDGPFAPAARGPTRDLLRRRELEPSGARGGGARASEHRPGPSPHRPARGGELEGGQPGDRALPRPARRAAHPQRAVHRGEGLERSPHRGGGGRVARGRAAGRRHRDHHRRSGIRRGGRRGGGARRALPAALVP